MADALSLLPEGFTIVEPEDKAATPDPLALLPEGFQITSEGGPDPMATLPEGFQIVGTEPEGPPQPQMFGSVMRGANAAQDSYSMLMGTLGIKSPEEVAADLQQNAADAAQYPQPASVAQTREQAAAALNQPAATWMDTAGNVAQAAGVYLQNPSDALSILGESAVPSVASMGAGAAGMIASGGNPLAGGAAAGAVSGAQEFGSSMRDFLTEKGIDPTNKDQLTAAFANQQLMAEAREYSIKRGVPVGLFDGISMGIAGKLFGAAKAVIPSKVAGTVVGATGETAMQAGLGAAGEAGGQLATKGKIDDKLALFDEAFFEGVSGVGEAGINKLTGKQGSPPAATEQPAGTELPPDPTTPATELPEQPADKAEIDYDALAKDAEEKDFEGYDALKGLIANQRKLVTEGTAKPESLLPIIAAAKVTREMFPDPRLMPSITPVQGMKDTEGNAVAGSYEPAKQAIRLDIGKDGNVDPDSNLVHENVHHADQLLANTEYGRASTQVFSKIANRVSRKGLYEGAPRSVRSQFGEAGTTFLKGLQLPAQDINEAEMKAYYVQAKRLDRRAGTVPQKQNFIGRGLDIAAEFFERMVNKLKGLGGRSANDYVDAYMSGEAGQMAADQGKFATPATIDTSKLKPVTETPTVEAKPTAPAAPSVEETAPVPAKATPAAEAPAPAKQIPFSEVKPLLKKDAGGSPVYTELQAMMSEVSGQKQASWPKLTGEQQQQIISRLKGGDVQYSRASLKEDMNALRKSPNGTPFYGRPISPADVARLGTTGAKAGPGRIYLPKGDEDRGYQHIVARGHGQEFKEYGFKGIEDALEFVAKERKSGDITPNGNRFDMTARRLNAAGDEVEVVVSLEPAADNKDGRNLYAVKTMYPRYTDPALQRRAETARRGADLKAMTPEQRNAAAKEGTLRFSRAVQQTGENAEEFAKWFGNSVTVDKNNEPQTYYHGTSKAFDKFGKARSGAMAGSSGPFFLSPDPEFANGYASADKAAGGTGKPTRGGRVIPAYVSAQNPFDYENPEHLAQIDAAIDAGEIKSKAVVQPGPDRIRKLVSMGSWQILETPSTQKWIKDNGFDGFHVREQGVKNLAVYDGKQIKSVFNEFKPGTAEDVRYSRAEPKKLMPKGMLPTSTFNLLYDKPNVKPGSRTLLEVGAYLRSLYDKAYGVGKNRLAETPKNKEDLSNWMAAEALRAYQESSSAIGWYEEKLRAAKNIMATIEPEILTNPELEAAFDFALAVTSNGQAVTKNFRDALAQYRAFKQTGQFPIIGYGDSMAAMESAFTMANTLIDEMGMEKFTKFLNTEFTVKDLQSMGFDASDAEMKDAKVFGSFILGPKIGQGFYQNLRGNFDPLTMDRWFMRFWNRLVGAPFMNTSDPTPRRAKIKNLILSKDLSELDHRLLWEAAGGILPESVDPVEVMRGLDLDANADMFDDYIQSVSRRFQSYYTATTKAKQKPVKSELMQSVGTHDKQTKGMLQEQPRGPKERAWIRQVVDRARDIMSANGVDINTADFQALVWYPEKRLWTDKLGVKKGQGEDVDYSDAAALIAKEEGVADDRIEEGRSAAAGRRADARGEDDAGTDEGSGQEGRSAYGQAFSRREQGDFIARQVSLTLKRRIGGTYSEESGNFRRKSSGNDRHPVTGSKTLAKHTLQVAAKNILEQFGFASQPIYELDPKLDAENFREQVITAAKSTKYGAAVTIKTVEELGKTRLFLSEDGSYGFALDGNDIVSVFSNTTSGNKRVTISMLELAKQLGGERLDAFDTVLPDIYSMAGFEARARLAFNDEYAPSIENGAADDWMDANGEPKEIWREFNNGRPDIVFMRYTGTERQYHSGDGVRVEEYDDGVAAQQAAETVRYSRATPQQASIVERIQGKPTSKWDGIINAVTSRSGRFAESITQELFDYLAPVKKLERANNQGVLREAKDSAYKQFRFANNGASVAASAIVDGPIRLRDGGYETVPGAKSFVQIVEPILSKYGAEGVYHWGGYVAAYRAQRLLAEGRERLMSASDIAELLLMGQTMPEFEQARQDWVRYNNHILDLAVDTGAITPDQRTLWQQSSDYVPFYRMMDDDNVVTPTVGKGLGRTSDASKRLKGGKAELGNIFENMVRNTETLVKKSVRSNAIRVFEREFGPTSFMGNALLERVPKVKPTQVAVPADNIRAAIAQRLGVPTNDPSLAIIPQTPAMYELVAMEPNLDPDTIVVRGPSPDPTDTSTKRLYRVKDPLLMRALSWFPPSNINFGTKVLMGFKQTLTHSITAAPPFMLRNLFRDTLQARALTNTNFIPVLDSVRGLTKSIRNSQEVKDLRAGGGSPIGAFYAHSSLSRFKQLTGSKTNPLIVSVQNAWGLLQKVGEATENANRIAIREGALKAGESLGEANYRALDIMDFSLRGASPMVGWLISVIPFLNARLQGAYRLGRGAKDAETRNTFLLWGAMFTLAAVGLAAMNGEDDRYNRETDVSKDNYIHLYLDKFFPKEALDAAGFDKFTEDYHIALPKPFEVGQFFMTVPERMYRYMAGKDQSKDLKDSALGVLTSVFKMHPVELAPVPLKSAFEYSVNYDSFRRRPIVPNFVESPEHPELEYFYNSPEIMKAFGDATGMSPIRSQKLIRDFAGTFGEYALMAAEMGWRAANGIPPAIKLHASESAVATGTGLSSFVRPNQPLYTKHEEEFYELSKEVQSLTKGMKRYVEEGRTGKAEKLIEDNETALSFNKSIAKVRDKLSDIRKAKVALYRTNDPANKQQILDLEAAEAQITQDFMEAYWKTQKDSVKK